MRCVLIAACTMLGVACGDPDPCDPAALTDALADARPGDTVRLGSCTVRGAFRVPPGVALQGVGMASVLEGDGTAPAVTLDATSGTTSLSSVRVVSPAGAAVVARGPGQVAIDAVDIEIETGLGLGLRDLSGGMIRDVTVEGPITAARAMSLPPEASLDDGAYGLAVLDSGSEESPIAFDRVSGLAIGPWGALVLDSHIVWNGGGIEGVTGTGILVQGGTARLDSVSVSDIHQGLQPLLAYGAAFTAGARVDSDGLSVERSDGLGLLADTATGVHTDLVSNDNRFGGFWIQRTDQLELSGSGSTFAGNGLAGIAVVASENVVVDGATIRDTREELSFFGELGSIMAGDGVNLVSEGPCTFRNLALTGNARVGILVDVGSGTVDGVTIESSYVDGTGSALGAIAQDASGLIAMGTWDAGIDRRGATGANDAAASTALPVVGAVDVANVPAPSVSLVEPAL